MKKSIVLDTNLLLDDAKIIFKLSKTYETIIIPITVLKELDKHKLNRDLSYSARTAIYEILNFKEEFPDKIELVVNDNELDSSDLKIIEAAINTDADIATKDISMSIIAESKNVNTKLYGTVSNGIYNPYFYLKQSKLAEFEYRDKYSNDVIDIFNLASNREILKDSWCFIFILDKKDEAVMLYANNPITGEVDRIDHLPRYRNIEVEGTSLKALDWYQICAIYALNEAPNVLLTGKWGSGKTLLGTAYALNMNKRKTFIMRAPIGINHKFDIGFLPGDKDSKLVEWCAGFLSALYYIYSNTKNQNTGNGNKYDYVKDRIFKEKFEPMPINAVQGMSLLKGDTLIVDEVQILDIDTLSMTLSRACVGSKVILLGDLSQTYSIVRPSESGLLKLLRMLPHHSLAYVDLQNHYRNNLIEIADLLQDKTL